MFIHVCKTFACAQFTGSENMASSRTSAQNNGPRVQNNGPRAQNNGPRAQNDGPRAQNNGPRV